MKQGNTDSVIQENTDSTIIELLASIHGIIPNEIGYDEQRGIVTLDISNKGIEQIPGELGKLSMLQKLDLRGNQLREIPGELGKLSNLQVLDLVDNPLLSTPSSEIVFEGIQAILAFLEEIHEKSDRCYEVDLILVGESGTGKSSLLRVLYGKDFRASLPTTYGIELDALTLSHPSLPACLLTLNTWDFGEQEIYRVADQFFLTKRSLYLVVWNVRLGGERGRLDYWLSTIHALAPDIPVFLVATHIDERPPDLDIPQYRKAYPQIVEVLRVSSKTKAGIHELKHCIAKYAAQLSLME